MAVYKENIVTVDLLDGRIYRSYMNVPIGEGDAASDRIGVKITKNGEPVSLAGSACVGFFVRPDGITLVIDGSTNGNMAYIDLPQAAYAKEGSYTLAIKISGTGFACTIRIVDGTIVNTTTGEFADPGSEIPTLEEYEEKVVRAEAAADTINALTLSATQIIGTRYKIAVTKTT